MFRNEHDDEPVRGLPARLPVGEHMLWQGAPAPLALAWHSMNAPWVAAYFAGLGLWRGTVVGQREGLLDGLTAASWYMAMGLVAIGVLVLMAWIMARATVYTITTHRLAMRIGAAFTVTLNLPYRWVAAADLAVHRDGTGTITLDLLGDTKLSYLVLWPHVRPWSVRRTRPALRCIRDPRAVADILSQAAAARITEVAGDDGRAEVRPIAAE